MSDPHPRPSVAPPRDAEQTIAFQLQRHAAGAGGRSVDTCTSCGKPPGLTVMQHQALAIRNHLMLNGLLPERDTGAGATQQPHEVEALLVAQLIAHATAVDARRPTLICRTCGPLPPRMDVPAHQASVIRDRLVQAGLMRHARTRPAERA